MIAVVYAVIVPVGLPYDEPSHWLNVTFIADHWRLPILGERGTGYEAQMGPVAYVVYAALLEANRLVRLPDSTSLYLDRLLGVAILVALYNVLRALIRHALPEAPATAATLGAATAAFNPMIVGMSTSIQNDTLSLTLGLGVIVLLYRWDGEDLAAVILISAMMSAAVLTKVTVWPIVPIAALFLGLKTRKSAATAVGLYSLVFVMLTGWWFIRNLTLYGDFTGRKGVEAAGYNFPPFRDPSPMRDAFHLARSVVTYLWIPDEYYRNTIIAPLLIRGVVVSATTLILLFGTLSLYVSVTRRLTRIALPLTVSALALASWAVLFFDVQSTAPRFAYPALCIWAILITAAASHKPGIRWRRISSVVLVGSLVVMHAWVLLCASSVIWPPSA